MRPDRQRRGARHGRGRKAGQAPERIPAPIQRAAAPFLYLVRPACRSPAESPALTHVPPFPGFSGRVGSVHPGHREKPARKPHAVRGLVLSWLVLSRPVLSRHALTVYVSPCSSTRPCCNAGAPCPAVLSTCLHVYMFTCLHVYKLPSEMAYLSAKTDIQRDKQRQTKTGAIKPRRFHFHLRASPCPCPSISKGTGQASPIGSAPGFPLR